ncbi:response regulator PleD [Anaerohalosphaera lusitana]|uniref:Response regulator PleD n=2 Tax=Anaerohalosphaera lusitana TaxID=1936003 RepID=A0A1U9NQE9_9BACT|nr:response regulator PleD [Anaerohalosphaera lusitana]
MNKKKDVLTTGQVAQICNVAPRTVTKWFDSGQLKGYRIPGSRDRRIPTGELLRFMKAHDMPTDALEIGKMRILIIDSDKDTAEDLAAGLETKRNYEVEIALNSFDAGIIAQRTTPHVILLNLMAQNIDADQICSYVRTNDELNSTRILAVAEGSGEKEEQALINKGYDGVISNAGDFTATIAMIQNASTVMQ